MAPEHEHHHRPGVRSRAIPRRRDAPEEDRAFDPSTSNRHSRWLESASTRIAEEPSPEPNGVAEYSLSDGVVVSGYVSPKAKSYQ